MSDRPRMRWPRSPAVWPAAGLASLLLANAIAGWFQGRNFLALAWHDGQLKGSLVDILKNGSYTMALALGMTLVIATGGIDLSVGAVMAVSGAVAAALLVQGIHSTAVALAAALGVALCCGLANGLLVARARIQPIVATLALMVAGRGVAQLITGGNVIIVKNPAFDFLGNGVVGGIPFAPLFVAALYVVVWAGLRRSAAGLFLEAVGDNETASRFAGLPAGRIKCLAYAACGLCAGLAGLLKASDIGSADPFNLGDTMELDAIFAVVVGGTALTGGRICLAGSFFGALLLQTLTVTMYYLDVRPAVAPMPKAVVIVAVCLAQSETVRRWFARRRQGKLT
jgi:ribose/xylose/arabinose/galactoside ABC-type transport system permease subunit